MDNFQVNDVVEVASGGCCGLIGTVFNARDPELIGVWLFGKDSSTEEIIGIREWFEPVELKVVGVAPNANRLKQLVRERRQVTRKAFVEAVNKKWRTTLSFEELMDVLLEPDEGGE